MSFILSIMQRRKDSKNSAAQNPRKIPKKRRRIPIKFKNGVGFYKISRAQKSGKPLTCAT
nr:hypothetical protein [uncultured Campylobacter sp.]